MRLSSALPLSNSWLPTADSSSPISDNASRFVPTATSSRLARQKSLEGVERLLRLHPLAEMLALNGEALRNYFLRKPEQAARNRDRLGGQRTDFTGDLASLGLDVPR